MLPPLLGGLLLITGCASFTDASLREWHEKPPLAVEAGPQPQVPGMPPDGALPGQPGTEPGNPPPPPQGCVDPDPQVIATCLDSVTAIAVLPGGQAALVAERSTGRLLRVERGTEPVEIARLPVDPLAADGGVTGLALSPSYHEDELIYAYVTTANANQVLRIAPGGDPPKPILADIPRGTSGNSGGIAADSTGALLVATGDAGVPAAADDPASLAGKVLRIDTFGKPAIRNPDPSSPVVASGLHNPGGLCVDPMDGTTWVTDRRDQQPDLLFQVRPGPMTTPAWTWPDRPGVAGCAAMPGLLAVAMTGAAGLYVLHPSTDRGFTGKPETILKNGYGRLHAAAIGPDGLVWLGTVNKAGGTPESSDDRVIRIQQPTNRGGGVD